MINFEKEKKIKFFLNSLSKVQPDHGKDIGLIVVEEETVGDFKKMVSNSNLTTVFDLDPDIDVTNFLEDLSKSLIKENTVFVRVHEYLSPTIYNQIYLISKSARMHIFAPNQDKVINIPNKAMLILVFSEDELEKLNYKDLLNIVGPVLRLKKQYASTI